MIDGARLVEGGVVGDAEMHAPRAGRGRRRSPRHWPCRAAVSISASRPTRVVQPLATSIWLTMHLDRVEVGRHADLRDQDRVELVAGLLHDVDDVAVHVVGVEAVDAHRHGLAGAAPVDVVERLDDVLARLLLVGRRHGVLAVEEDEVGGALRAPSRSSSGWSPARRARCAAGAACGGGRACGSSWAFLWASFVHCSRLGGWLRPSRSLRQRSGAKRRRVQSTSSRASASAPAGSWRTPWWSCGSARPPRRCPSRVRRRRRNRAAPFRRRTARRRP